MLVQLIYISTPVATSRADISSSVTEFYYRNKDLGINSILIAADTFFLQVLEGPRELVNLLYGKISNDPRHKNVTILRCQEIRKVEFALSYFVYLGDDTTSLEFLNDIADISTITNFSISSATAMAMLRRALAVHKCLTYPNRRKTDIASIPELPVTHDTH